MGRHTKGANIVFLASVEWWLCGHLVSRAGGSPAYEMGQLAGKLPSVYQSAR